MNPTYIYSSLLLFCIITTVLIVLMLVLGTNNNAHKRNKESEILLSTFTPTNLSDDELEFDFY